MPLPPRTRFGPYEILAPIGAGGMGEVYRALDTRLEREVAIKVLPAAVATDPERLARFEREAKVLAQLNHSGIASVYGVEDQALVMELVPGPTLAERIQQAPIPPGEAEEILLQIADAMEYAHERGIIHRDLKPANIKIDPEEKVKILDFGLAKALSDPMAAASGNPANSPTVTMGATVAGTLLGTAGYMAPEQARGKRVDRRADIWAFGVVAYEMLTGERLFQGDDTVQVLSRVLEHQPDLGRVPVKFRKLLARCLDRNPKDRLRDIGEARFLLQESAPTVEPAAAGPVAHPGAASRLWPAATALLALTSAALGYVAYRHSTEEPARVERFSLLRPEGTRSTAAGTAIAQISPDGRRIVFPADSGGEQSLWLHDLDSLHARVLPGTSGGAFPFWSPDSRWVAFFADGKLKKVDVTGGPAIALCDVNAAGPGGRPNVRGGAWNQDDVIVFGMQNSGLFRVPAAGGTPAAMSEPNRAAGETAGHYYPAFLPDGRHFLYTARSQNASQTRVYVESIDAKPGSGTRKEVLAADSNAVYVPAPTGRSPFAHERGYLLFVRDRNLMAQPFDASSRQATGDAVPVPAEPVARVDGISLSLFSASRTGTLVYTSGTLGAGKQQLTWVDRNGKATGTVALTEDVLSASISPDGSAIATDPLGPSSPRDIWIHDLARGTNRRLTFGLGVNSFPIWSPDGSRVVYDTVRDANNNPYLKAANGLGGEEILDKDPRNNHVEDWSRDGRYVLERRLETNKGSDIWVLPQFGDRKPFPYLDSEFREFNARLSPNGQWLAYVSDESKRPEVYVQTFPEHGGKWQISTDGGNFPVWSRDGRELYFIGGDRKMMAVPVGGNGRNFVPGVPKALFDAPPLDQFDVSKDGRFLFHIPIEPGAANALTTVVTNWQASLKK